MVKVGGLGKLEPWGVGGEVGEEALAQTSSGLLPLPHCCPVPTSVASVGLATSPTCPWYALSGTSTGARLFYDGILSVGNGPPFPQNLSLKLSPNFSLPRTGLVHRRCFNKYLLN